MLSEVSVQCLHLERFAVLREVDDVAVQRYDAGVEEAIRLKPALVQLAVCAKRVNHCSEAVGNGLVCSRIDEAAVARSIGLSPGGQVKLKFYKLGKGYCI